MKIDLRQPIMVLAGRWNPHIFNLDWMAVHLFQIEAGTTVEIAQAAPPERSQPITFISDVGISCTGERLEFFATGVDDASFAKVEDLAERVLEKLSHTPTFGLGVNFKFFDEDVDAKFSDALSTRENLEDKYKVSSSEVKSSLQIDSDVVLNLARAVGESGVVVIFNFHQSVSGTEIAKGIVRGALSKYYEQAKGFMAAHYEQDDFEIERYGARKEGTDDEQ